MMLRVARKGAPTEYVDLGPGVARMYARRSGPMSFSIPVTIADGMTPVIQGSVMSVPKLREPAPQRSLSLSRNNSGKTK